MHSECRAWHVHRASCCDLLPTCSPEVPLWPPVLPRSETTGMGKFCYLCAFFRQHAFSCSIVCVLCRLFAQHLPAATQTCHAHISHLHSLPLAQPFRPRRFRHLSNMHLLCFPALALFSMLLLCFVFRGGTSWLFFVSTTEICDGQLDPQAGKYGQRVVMVMFVVDCRAFCGKRLFTDPILGRDMMAGQ